ncbi:hypothetical protein ACJX0J_041891, partial [Zea mays]
MFNLNLGEARTFISLHTPFFYDHILRYPFTFSICLYPIKILLAHEDNRKQNIFQHHLISHWFYKFIDPLRAIIVCLHNIAHLANLPDNYVLAWYFTSRIKLAAMSLSTSTSICGR